MDYICRCFKKMKNCKKWSCLSLVFIYNKGLIWKYKFLVQSPPPLALYLLKSGNRTC